jgi:hypothetical protein
MRCLVEPIIRILSALILTSAACRIPPNTPKISANHRLRPFQKRFQKILLTDSPPMRENENGLSQLRSGLNWTQTRRPVFPCKTSPLLDGLQCLRDVARLEKS